MNSRKKTIEVDKYLFGNYLHLYYWTNIDGEKSVSNAQPIIKEFKEPKKPEEIIKLLISQTLEVQLEAIDSIVTLTIMDCKLNNFSESDFFSW